MNYGWVSYKCGKKRYQEYAHRLAFMKKKNLQQLGKNGEVSHLCHNSLCVQESHLVFEPKTVNNNRQRCVKQGKCTGHGKGRRRCMLKLRSVNITN